VLTDEKSYSILHKAIPRFPDTVMVLGSGWNSVVNMMEERIEIGYEKLFGVSSTVPGHKGKLIVGKINNKPVTVMSGRFHMFEGFTALQATSFIRVFAKAGMKSLILTAACGALNTTYRIGDFVVLNDIITLLLSPDSPLVGPQFIDTSCVFDPCFRAKAVAVIKKNHIRYHEGSYIYYHGPNFETPADKRAMKILGADVCGMSTVPETLVARSLGVKVLGLAFVTNLAFVKHDHKEVLKEAEKGSKKMKILLRAIL